MICHKLATNTETSTVSSNYMRESNAWSYGYSS